MDRFLGRIAQRDEAHALVHKLDPNQRAIVYLIQNFWFALLSERHLKPNRYLVVDAGRCDTRPKVVL
jgi:hypothetical protein